MTYLYRCRLCGEVYTERRPDADSADRRITELMYRRADGSDPKLSWHRCKHGGRIGISDMIGLYDEQDQRNGE